MNWISIMTSKTRYVLVEFKTLNQSFLSFFVRLSPNIKHGVLKGKVDNLLYYTIFNEKNIILCLIIIFASGPFRSPRIRFGESGGHDNYQEYGLNSCSLQAEAEGTTAAKF